MLTGKSIVVIGGDARYIELMHQLVMSDASVFAVGYEEYQEKESEVQYVTIEDLNQEALDAVILPITGLDEAGFAEAHYAEKSPRVSSEWLNDLPENTLIFTGIRTQYLNDVTHENIVALFDRDDIAIYNSIPTAEGTVMLAIQYTPITIHNANVTILGFGRVGKSLVNAFQGLGANVSVAARKETDLARIFETRAKPLQLEQLSEEVRECDILINTIPTRIVTPEVIHNLSKSCLILDLASKPGGVDYRYAKKKGVKAILAPGLPGMVAPQTAGKILAQVIQTIIL
ncbi:dipicolinic acid synthetase subunit A [Halalkalibacillus halophilus]|uniref:dipicolinic acid synthetase subunit A n=1 Tax=Halalkalibacillus halophilus TaxID=392827 RepID=UPI00041ADFEF|nr:dipicolinic acid synthetase subunit A [Halalkalibacillus halophilus]